MIMSRIRWQAVAVALCLCASTALGHWIKPTTHLADSQEKMSLEAAFPRDFGEWRLDTNLPVSIVSPDVKAMLDQLYNQVLARTYVNDRGERIMLSVAYGGDQSDATRAHRPDVCYPAQGFDIVSARTSAIALPQGRLPVRHMVARLGSRNEPVTFWFTVGDQVAVSGQDQKLAQLRYGLRGLIPDGMLVRVSSINQDNEAAFALQNRFVAAMRAAFDESWAPRVFGVQVTGKR